MLKVKITLTGSGELELYLSGHAECAPAGSDTVCAAASMLAYAAAKEVLEMERQGKLRGEPHITLGKGDSQILCEYKGNAWSEAKILYRIIRNGYDMLAANFPQNVKLAVF